MKNSPFSADDRAEPEINPSIGELDTHYRAMQARKINGETGKVKRVAVRDASGSLNDEEPVHAFMIPSKYLQPDTNGRMAPKRPLGQPAARQTRAGRQPAKMYSQVATFGAQPRIRRPRMVIPVTEQDDAGWLDRLKHYTGVLASLLVAGLLFAGDTLQKAWTVVTRKVGALIVAVPFGHVRTLYSRTAGAHLKRLGMEDSHFRVVVPIALVLFLLGLAIFSSFVGDNIRLPGKPNENTGTQQGSTTLQVTPSSSHGGDGNVATSQGASNNSPQGGGAAQGASAAQRTQNASAAGTQSSSARSLGSGSAPTNGGMGGMGGGSVPTISTGSNTVTQAVPTPPSSTTPTAPAPTTSGGSGSGSSSSSSSSSSSGGGLPLPVDPTTPLPTTLTVPGTDSSLGGKTLESTTPVGVTLN